MYLGRVLGTVVATVKYEGLEGYRLLVVEPIFEDGRPAGEPVVAVDATQAGPGERVFCVASREAARCRSGVVVAAREGHFSCSSCGRAPAAAFCCPDPTRGFRGATAPREGNAALGRVSAIPAARG